MKNRQLHLWIGLLTSILVLVESVTGLLLAEPWLMGATARPQMEQGMNPTDIAAFSQSGEQGRSFDRGGPGRNFSGGEGRNGLMGLVKNLHAGRIGNTDVSFAASLTAVALIILTSTGIVLSVRVLRAQSKSKQKTATQI